ncbi:MAG TPA: hypothetical protein VGJ38_09535 [Jatrophihabitantaceae bacterium]
MGLDRLKWLALPLIVCVASGCDSSGRPERLLYGERAAEFRPVHGSVISIGRVLRGTTLGRRFTRCVDGFRFTSVAPDARVVERIGVFAESLTFADRRGRILYACDGGLDAAGERSPPWCSSSAGRLFERRLLDPRLDIACRDRRGRPLAYAWIEPVAAARWIGVDQGAYTEMYEVLAGLPVRVATKSHIELGRSGAEFEITQYDAHGRELVRATVDAAVAG